ncbi:cobalt-precorrin-5B (C(1))-methyltransferase CbiD [Methanobrevibacter sp. OttesenSCG-928-K11]|nr:cobalt-precorrin-5B (C(1))-methyltransferase CbiD [Methanobrevibacter sp. OttesenSCG-928-K11]MDL2270471.1 cobalt-precorrin-5B (C(1))-methyltransferase CbiD [Methanobrevibacter sp. OttesenSCG-928-I08]
MNIKNNEIGVTTGSIATATALSALKQITSNESPDIVNIQTPSSSLDIIIEKNEKISDNVAKSIAIKYPYNDPDVTVNLEIITTVELVDEIKDKKVIITGGAGIGKVTKPGLQIPIGEYAINPVPREMIKDNLYNHIPKNKSAKVKIAIPKACEIVNNTMNPRLGIVGGISILGTTGIARAMSTDAYKRSITPQIDISIGEKLDDLVFVPGNIGEKIALEKLNVNKDQIIQTGNYIGYMFDYASKKGIKSFTFLGHIGKLVKVAGGIFNTKHSIADGRKEIIITHSALRGASIDIINKIYSSETTESMISILKEESLDKFVFNSIAKAIKDKCTDKFDIDLNVILVDMKGNILNTNFDNNLIKEN